MITRIRTHLHREDGASAVEYALLVVGIALVLIVGAFALGNALNTQFNNDAKCVQATTATGCTP